MAAGRALDPVRHLLGLLAAAHWALARRRVGGVPLSTVVTLALLGLALWSVLTARRIRREDRATPRVTITDIAQGGVQSPIVHVEGLALYSAVWAERPSAAQGDTTRSGRWFYLVTDGRSAVAAVAPHDPYVAGRDTAHVDFRATLAPLPAGLGAQLLQDPDVSRTFERVGTTQYLEPLPSRSAGTWTIAGIAAWLAALIFSLGRLHLWTSFAPEAAPRGRRGSRETRPIPKAGLPVFLTAAIIAAPRGRRTRMTLRAAHATAHPRSEGGADLRLDAGPVVPGGAAFVLSIPAGARAEPGRVFDRLATRPAVRVRLGTGALYVATRSHEERQALLDLLAAS